MKYTVIVQNVSEQSFFEAYAGISETEALRTVKLCLQTLAVGKGTAEVIAGMGQERVTTMVEEGKRVA